MTTKKIKHQIKITNQPRKKNSHSNGLRKIEKNVIRMLPAEKEDA